MMFERRHLLPLARHWAYEFAIADRTGMDKLQLLRMYERYKDMLTLHCNNFKGHLFDKHSDVDLYFNEDGSVK